jgi:WD40 repeat protein
MTTLTHHHKSVRSLAVHPTEYSFASASAGGNNIKKWACPQGTFVHNFSGHDAIINTISVNQDGAFFSGGTFTCRFSLSLYTVLMHSPPISSLLDYRRRQTRSRQRIHHLLGLQDRSSLPDHAGRASTRFTGRRERHRTFPHTFGDVVGVVVAF